MPRLFQRGRFGSFASVIALAFLIQFPCLVCAQIEVEEGDSGAIADSLRMGNEAFDSEDFGEAIGAYEKAVEMGHLSADLFLLLGNAHFRNGSPGAASLWWRRAQIASPFQAEAAQNLRFLDSKAGLLRFKSDTASTVSGILPSGAWMAIGIAGGWAFVIGVVALSLQPPRKLWRTIAHLACWIGLLIAVTGIAGYLLRSNRDIPHLLDLAVMTQTATARTSATEGGATVTELPPGSEVTILGERGPWLYVGIPGNLRGWIRTGTATPLWPFEPAHIQ